MDDEIVLTDPLDIKKIIMGADTSGRYKYVSTDGGTTWIKVEVSNG